MEKRVNLSHCHHFVMVLLGFWDFFFFLLVYMWHFGYSLSVCVGGGLIPQLDYSKIFNYMFYILILL